jgi:hypothetical protein
MSRIAYVGEWRDHNKIFVDGSNGGVTIILPDNLTEKQEENKSLKEIISNFVVKK